MSEGIDGKVVFITGGSTGLGAETARLLAERGAKVALSIAQPPDVDINAIVLRPIGQQF